MVASSYAFQVSCSLQRPSVSPKDDAHSRPSLSSSLHLKTFLKVFQQNPVFGNVDRTVKEASLRLLDAFVDLAFEIVDKPLLPSQEIASRYPRTRAHAIFRKRQIVIDNQKHMINRMSARVADARREKQEWERKANKFL